MTKKIEYDFEKRFLKIKIDKKEISHYIQRLKDYLREKYEIIYSNKAKRDGDNYHITIFSWIECKKIKDYISVISGQIINDIEYVGIGRATDGVNETYYIVVKSDQIDMLRNEYGFSKKDLHITLGFDKVDLHNVKKDENTIILESVDGANHENVNRIEDDVDDSLVVITVDMDGTIADPETRDTNKKKYYEYQLCMQDEPILNTINFLKRVYNAYNRKGKKVGFIILTGRNDYMKKDGVRIDLVSLYREWWNLHVGLPLIDVIAKERERMSVSTSKFKIEKIRYLKNKHNLAFHIDDDVDVINELKNENIRVYHVVNKNKITKAHG